MSNEVQKPVEPQTSLEARKPNRPLPLRHPPVRASSCEAPYLKVRHNEWPAFAPRRRCAGVAQAKPSLQMERWSCGGRVSPDWSGDRRCLRPSNALL